MWESKLLGELCEIARGGSPRPIKAYITNSDNGVNWIKIADASASSKYIYKTKEKIKPEGIKHSRFVKEGDFLLSNSMSFGRPYILKTSGCIHDGWLVLRDKTKSIFPDYLYYFLGSDETYKQFDKLAAGSTVRNLNIDLAKKVKILLPPIETQKRIVAILDEAFEGIDAAIANTQANLAAARELFERFVEEISFKSTYDRNCTTVDVTHIAKPIKGSIRTGPFGSQLLHSEFVSNGISVLGIDNAVSNQFEWRKKRFISSEKYQELKRYTVYPGDVLITIMGTCGRCAVVPNDIPTSINTKHLCCITLDQKKCLPDYLHAYFLYHPKAKEYLVRNAKGTVMDGLNMGIIKSLPVMLPTLQLQQQIVYSIKDFQSSILELTNNYHQKLAALHELKQSILDKAFRGELTQNEVAA